MPHIFVARESLGSFLFSNVHCALQLTLIIGNGFDRQMTGNPSPFERCRDYTRTPPVHTMGLPFRAYQPVTGISERKY